MNLGAQQLVYLALALFAGMTIPFQTSFNTILGKAAGSPIVSTIIVFIIATFFLVAVALLFRSPIPSAKSFEGLPIVGWIGGILGAIYVVILVLVAPKLGVGITTVMVVFGQILMGLTVDHFGLFGLPQTKFGWMRALALVFMSLGVGILKFLS